MFYAKIMAETLEVWMTPETRPDIFLHASNPAGTVGESQHSPGGLMLPIGPWGMSGMTSEEVS